MALPVDLRTVVEMLNLADDETHAYINRKSGELFAFSEYEFSLDALEDEDVDVPDWAAETLVEARKVVACDDFVELPDPFEINEYSIVERFALEIEDARLGDRLLAAIRGSGAFRRFRDALVREGIRDRWFAYRDAALGEIAADFLEAAGIPYRAETDPPAGE